MDKYASEGIDRNMLRDLGMRTKFPGGVPELATHVNTLPPEPGKQAGFDDGQLKKIADRAMPQPVRFRETAAGPANIPKGESLMDNMLKAAPVLMNIRRF